MSAPSDPIASAMTCRAINAFLADYLDGALVPDVRTRFETHLGRCPRCLEYLIGYRHTIRLVRATGVPEHDATVIAMPEDLVQAVLASRRAID